jgi:hypothetical protein
MITTQRPRRSRRQIPRTATERAYAPLRRVIQSRYTRDSREAVLRQYERLTAEDLPPISAVRGAYYRPAPVADLPQSWHPPIATILGLLVALVILWGFR